LRQATELPEQTFVSPPPPPTNQQKRITQETWGRGRRGRGDGRTNLRLVSLGAGGIHVGRRRVEVLVVVPLSASRGARAVERRAGLVVLRFHLGPNRLRRRGEAEGKKCFCEWSYNQNSAFYRVTLLIGTVYGVPKITVYWLLCIRSCPFM
jgi:transposase InsO family protein